MKTMVGTIYYFIIEIGYTHYLFSVERYIENNEINIIPQLLEAKNECKKRSKYPISLISINLPFTIIFIKRTNGANRVSRNW